jgi:ATP-dependent helicase/nuclease subunit B
LTIENDKINAALAAGGTVVVPTRQRAAALRMAFARARMAAGARAWESCDVLPWNAWLERCAAQAHLRPQRALRPLGAAEEWLLWRAAAEEACEGFGVLRAASLGDALRRSWSLERDWGLADTGDVTTEALVLRRGREAFQRRCRALGAYAVADWSLTLQEPLPAPAGLLFAGFEAIGPALAARLAALGGRFTTSRDRPAGATPEEVGGADRSDELRLAASWCRQVLERDPAARLLVVVPQLGTVRALALQIFEHTLHGRDLMDRPAEPLYAVEGGQSLADFPLVHAALALIRLATGALPFAELAPLLRSGYVDCGPRAGRLLLELALRERNVTRADLADLAGLAGTLRGGAGPALQSALQALQRALPQAPRSGADAAWWARGYAALLEAGGWPGPAALGSAEQQQRDRLRELLGELALTGVSGMRHDAAGAQELLRALAQRTAFDPASGDVPVTLTESTDDPLVVYDGLWVAGLDAETWAPPSRPDPFLPVEAQRAAGLPMASAAGQRAAAIRSMDAWGRCARRWVVSWPHHDGEVPLQRSSLLAPAPGQAAAVAAAPVAAMDPLVSGLRRAAVRERRPADLALAWPGEQPLPGGTRALQLQSQCPFRAVAELRLGAVALREPLPGFDPRERGRILHRALELLWRGLPDARTLRVRAAAGTLAGEVRAATTEALEAGLAGRTPPLAAALVYNELRRMQVLVTGLLQQELGRVGAAEFSVAQLEDSQQHLLAGHPIRVRMDRVDRLEDGRVIVIDYKSGAARPFRPLDERPEQPQLLIYASLAGAAAVAGVAAVHVNAEGSRWCGAAADRDLLPTLGRSRAPSAPWPELLAHWRRVVDGLVLDFVAGESAVDPLPGVCRNCHLPALCRIDGMRQAEAEERAEAQTELDGAGGETQGGETEGAAPEVRNGA